MPFTNYFDQHVLQAYFSATAYAAPGTWYVALSTTTPTNAGANFTEPTGGAYARVAVTNNGTNWHAFPSQPGSGYEVSNATAVTFPAATASWGTVTYFGIFDAVSAGNLIGFGALTASQAIGNGNTASFAVDALTITNT